MKTHGTHLLADLHGCDVGVLDDPVAIETAMLVAAREKKNAADERKRREEALGTALGASLGASLGCALGEAVVGATLGMGVGGGGGGTKRFLRGGSQSSLPKV